MAYSTADAATIFSGGNFESSANWDNGTPTAGNDGTISVDGTWVGSTTGFPAGSIVNQTAGTLTAAGTEGFNMNGGGTWNMSGGTIIARYYLPNGSTNVFNLSGGSRSFSPTIPTATADWAMASGWIRRRPFANYSRRSQAPAITSRRRPRTAML